MDLQQTFGNLDIYLFDQLLKGRITPSHRILDAGAGGGRNVHYLMGAGFDVYGVDRDAGAVAALRRLAVERGVSDGGMATVEERFRVADATALPHDDATFDVVIANALLHFADDERTFTRMVDEMWRVLAPDGTLFVRLATSIGVEGRIRPIEGRDPHWHTLPDGSDRYLVDEAELHRLTERLGATPLELLKTTNVQNLRAMTTWVVGKSAP